MFKKIQSTFSENLSQEEYDCIKPIVAQQNMKTLQFFSFLIAFLSVTLVILTAAQLIPSLTMNRNAYCIVGILSYVVFFIAWLVLPKHYSLTKPMFYVFLMIIIVFSIYIGVITNVDQRGSTICVLVFAIPLLIIDRPFRISILMSLAVLAFCVTSYFNKEYTLFISDFVNSVLILIISIGVNFAQQNMKYRTISDRYIIDQNNLQMIHTQKTELEESRISIMLSQIQPHFLYNSLSAISYLCEKDPMAAQAAINDFSDYLRVNMDSLKLTVPIPFEKELDHVRIYLSLEKMRFDDDLEIVYDIQTKGFFIPSLTLQPLVENAVRYGIYKKKNGGTVNIITREHDEYFEIVVKDDGVGYNLDEIQNDGRSHIGIDNVRSRLMTMVGGTLEIVSEKDVGTTAIIKLPKEKIV